MIDGEKLLVEKEISKKFGLSIHWFKKARHTGYTPPYHKLNGKVYYKESEVNEWFKKHLQKIDQQ